MIPTLYDLIRDWSLLDQTIEWREDEHGLVHYTATSRQDIFFDIFDNYVNCYGTVPFTKLYAADPEFFDKLGAIITANSGTTMRLWRALTFKGSSVLGPGYIYAPHIPTLYDHIPI